MRRTAGKLTLHLEGERITAEHFRQATEAFFDLLREVTAEMAGSSRAVEWIVEVKSGSINLSAAPEARAQLPVSPIVTAVFDGVRLLEQRGKRPPHFNDKALSSARTITRLAEGHGIEKARLRFKKNTTTLRKTAANVDEILGAPIYEIGSIEGRLQMISSRGGFHFGVWDVVSDKFIRCNVRKERFPDVYRAFDHRVAVLGMVRFRKTGEPVSIDVEKIVTLPEDKDLPTHEEVYGIMSRTG